MNSKYIERLEEDSALIKELGAKVQYGTLDMLSLHSLLIC